MLSPNHAWLISFIIAWIVFFLLVDWSRLKYTVWGGLFTVAIQLLVDTMAIKMNFYRVEGLVYIITSSVFFTFGVVFVVAILFTQTLPESRWLQGTNILVISGLFTLQEVLFVQMGVLQYINWNQPASTFINVLVITTLTWLVDSLGLNRAGRSLWGGYKS